MAGMGVFMLLGVLMVALILGGAVYLAIRIADRAPRQRDPEALDVLQRRLANGDISADEYYERESALRDADRPRRRLTWCA